MKAKLGYLKAGEDECEGCHKRCGDLDEVRQGRNAARLFCPACVAKLQALIEERPELKNQISFNPYSRGFDFA